MVVKEDCQLFAKLFISRQNRECELKEFFCHENQAFPASPSNGENLHVCQKSQLSGILEKKVTFYNQTILTENNSAVSKMMVAASSGWWRAALMMALALLATILQCKPDSIDDSMPEK